MELIKVQTLLDESPKFRGITSCVRIIPLKGDASSRRYSRVLLKGGPYKSIIIMELAGGQGPVISEDLTISQDETFVQIEQFLSEHDIPHPLIIEDLRLQNLLLVEDVGDIALWRLSRDTESADIKEVVKVLGPDYLYQAYAKAIDIILLLQRIPSNNADLPFKRHLGYEPIYTESRRFIDYYCAPRGLAQAKIVDLEMLLKELSRSISEHPYVVSHRDYMAWNIHLNSEGALQIIDFQDMLMAPKAYDLMCLLTDRNIDIDLGYDLECRLKDYFFTKSFPDQNQREEFERMYNELLLQRSLRLVGQFTYLAEQKKSDFYASLVPGCIRRCRRIVKSLPVYAPLVEAIDRMPSS